MITSPHTGPHDKFAPRSRFRFNKAPIIRVDLQTKLSDQVDGYYRRIKLVHTEDTFKWCLEVYNRLKNPFAI